MCLIVILSVSCLNLTVNLTVFLWKPLASMLAFSGLSTRILLIFTFIRFSTLNNVNKRLNWRFYGLGCCVLCCRGLFAGCWSRLVLCFYVRVLNWKMSLSNLTLPALCCWTNMQTTSQPTAPRRMTMWVKPRLHPDHNWVWL